MAEGEQLSVEIPELKGVGISIDGDNVILEFSNNEVVADEPFEPNVTARIAVKNEVYSVFIKILVQLGRGLKEENPNIDLGDLYKEEAAGGE